MALEAPTAMRIYIYDIARSTIIHPVWYILTPNARNV
jgi:hypothetical protein